jgi:hypothetical protein
MTLILRLWTFAMHLNAASTTSAASCRILPHLDASRMHPDASECIQDAFRMHPADFFLKFWGCILCILLLLK